MSGYEITTIDPATGDVVWTAPVAIHHSGISTILAIGDVLYVPTYGFDTAPQRMHRPRSTPPPGPTSGACRLDGPGPAHVDGSALPRGGGVGPVGRRHDDVRPDAVGRARRCGSAWSTPPTPTALGAGRVSDARNAELGNPVIVGGEVMAVLSVEGSPSVLQRWPLACAARSLRPRHHAHALELARPPHRRLR